MPVSRSQRNYPLTLTADALNTGIVSAFDWAAEDGSTTASNGKDHSGNNRHFTAPGTAPTIVQTAAGKGRDTSMARTSASNYYDAAGATTIGMAVGTGDFSIYKRIRTPSQTPTSTTLRQIGRIADSGGTKIGFNLYEVLSTLAWHWQIVFDATSIFLWNDSGNPAIPPGTDSILHITRTSGTVKFFVNGVLKKTVNGNTTNILGTTGASHTIVGNYTTGQIGVDAVYLDDIYWSRALSDAEVAAHAANPYSYYANGGPPDSVTLNTPADGATVGANIPITGTYAGANLPGAIQASFNGGAWATIDAAPTGGTFSGTLTGQTPGTGTLSVRWSNNNAITDNNTGIIVSANSIALTTPNSQLSPFQYRTFQRNGSNQATVKLTGTYDGSPTAIEWRWNGSAWATLVSSPAGGVFDQNVTLNGVGQGLLEVRFANATSVLASVAYIGVGDVYIVMGQSNNVGMATSFVVPAAPTNNPTWKPTMFGKNGAWKEHKESTGNEFDDRTSATYAVQTNGAAIGGSYFGALSTKIMATGVPVAFVPCALGSTSISSWAVSTSTGTLYGAALARATEIGDHKGVIWWQGENEASGSSTQAQHVAALNALVNDWFTRTGRKWYVWAINATGTGGNFQAIHDALIEVGQTNANVAGYADLNGSFSSSIHYLNVGEINEIANRTFAALPYAGTLISTLGAATLSAVGAVKVSGAYASTLQALTLAATGTAAGAPSPITGGLSKTLLGMTLVASGTAAAGPISGQLDAVLQGLMADAAARLDIVGQMSAVLAGSTLVAAGGSFVFAQSRSRTAAARPAQPSQKAEEIPVYRQQTDCKLDYSVDWSPWLTDSGDSIASYQITVPARLTNGGVMLDDKVTTVWIGDGVANYQHVIKFKIVTAAGRIICKKILLQIDP